MSEKVVKHADEMTPQPPESRAGHFVSIDDYTAEDMQEGQAFKVETTAPDRDVLQAGVPVEKPGKHRWIQTHPDDDYWLRHWSFVLKTGMEERWHPFPAQAADVVPEDLQVNMLFVFSMDLQGNAFWWPVANPGLEESDSIDGFGVADDTSLWPRTRYEAARQARHAWVRVVANKKQGSQVVPGYSVELSEQVAKPVWPPHDPMVLFRASFRTRFVDRRDHPALLELRGEK